MELNKIYEGMPKAGECIDENFNMLKTEDTGWIKLVLLNGATPNTNPVHAPYWRVVNKTLYFKGLIRLPRNGMVVANMPSNYRISGNVYKGTNHVGPSDQNSIFEIRSNGEIFAQFVATNALDIILADLSGIRLD